MKIDKQKRQSITAAQKITSSIAEALKHPKHEEKSAAKVDLTKIAMDLAERREKVLKGEKDGE